VLLLDTSFLVEYECEIVANKVGAARGFIRANPRESYAVSIARWQEALAAWQATGSDRDRDF